MGHGAYTIYPVILASNTTLTPAVDLSRAWGSAFLHIPSGTSNTQYWVHAAPTLAGAYCRISQAPINSSTVGINDFTIHTAATGRVVPIPNGVRFVKLETSGPVSNGATYNILVADF